MASSSTPTVHQCQAWSEVERQAIKTYAGTDPKATRRQIKRWFESEHPNKILTRSQISKILNPKRPRGPSDVDPIQVQKSYPAQDHWLSGASRSHLLLRPTPLLHYLRLLSLPLLSFVYLLFVCSCCIYYLIAQLFLPPTSFIWYFPIFSWYKNILVTSILPPVRTICLYREYTVHRQRATDDDRGSDTAELPINLEIEVASHSYGRGNGHRNRHRNRYRNEYDVDVVPGLLPILDVPR